LPALPAVPPLDLVAAAPAAPPHFIPNPDTPIG